MYLARDIPAFVMCCVNGESGSSLLIESIDSMIEKSAARPMVRFLGIPTKRKAFCRKRRFLKSVEHIY